MTIHTRLHSLAELVPWNRFLGSYRFSVFFFIRVKEEICAYTVYCANILTHRLLTLAYSSKIKAELCPQKTVLRIQVILVRIWMRIQILLFSSATFKKSSFFAYYFFKVRLHHFSKIKSLKKVSKQ